MGDAGIRIDGHVGHRGGVDEHLVGPDRRTGTMPAGLHRHAQIMIGSPAHRLGDLLGTARVGDHSRLLRRSGIQWGGPGAILRAAGPRQQVQTHLAHYRSF